MSQVYKRKPPNNLQSNRNAAAKVHVIIPTFNSEKYIIQTLESVASQNYDIDSLIVTVVDNCSSDRTVDLIKNFKKLDVEIIINSSNVGALNNHNKALDLCRGEFLKILSSDDILKPEAIDNQVDLLSRHTDCVLCTSNFELINEAGVAIGAGSYYRGKNAGDKIRDLYFKRFVNIIGCPSSVMIRVNKIFDARFNPSYPWIGDVFFFLDLLKSGNYINTDSKDFFYRARNDSDSIMSCPPLVRVHDELHAMWCANALSLSNISSCLIRFFTTSAVYLKRKLMSK